MIDDWILIDYSEKLELENALWKQKIINSYLLIFRGYSLLRHEVYFTSQLGMNRYRVAITTQSDILFIYLVLNYRARFIIKPHNHRTVILQNYC